MRTSTRCSVPNVIVANFVIINIIFLNKMLYISPGAPEETCRKQGKPMQMSALLYNEPNGKITNGHATSLLIPLVVTL